mgnify:CR=1 FL=1
MSGGGSGGGAPQVAPVAPSYTDPINGKTFTTTDDLNAEIAARTASDKAASDAAKAQADAILAGNRTQFQNDLVAGRNAATERTRNYFTQQGYDPARFESDIARAINAAAGTIIDPNTVATTAPTTAQTFLPQINSAFSPSLGASILSSINAGNQSKANNAINSIFSPTYAQDNISNEWLTPAASTVLSEQFDPLDAQLTNAFKRGSLNQTGYDAALKALSGKRTAANATVSNLGNNILAADRTDIDNYITGAKADAANVNANTYDSFDPNRYLTGATDKVNRYKTNFGGDLTNAIGSTTFADLSSLLNAGGAVQGATDPTATNPTSGTGGSAISDAYIAQQALAKEKRGLGSNGAF